MTSKASEFISTLIIMTLVLAMFGPFMKVDFSWNQILIPVYPADLIAGITTGFMMILFRRKWRILWEMPGIKIWLAWIGLAIIGWLLILPQTKSSEIVVGLSYLLRYCIYTSWIWLIALSLDERQKVQMLRVVMVVTLVFAIFGLGQYLISPDMRFLYYSGWDDHYYRLTGLFLDPGYTGLWLVWGLILWLNEYVKDSDKWQIHLGKTVAMIVLVVSVGLTFSRASYLAAVTGV